MALRSRLPVQRLTYSVDEAASAIGVSRSYFYELITGGDIPICKVGRRTFVLVEDITAYLKKQRSYGLHSDG